jgi:DNA repair exonuclease SbcCD ATPase subunit
VKINTLKIKGFLGIGEAEIGLDDRGLVLIQGVNNDDDSADSNGSGKSSLIDALFWCLYGKTSRGLAGDDVINNVTGKNCVVSVIATIDGQNVVITRWRKSKDFHKTSGVSLTVDGVDKTGGTDTLTQMLIDQVVGCNENVFQAAVYSGQENMIDIPSMSDRELKTLIENAANIDLIEVAYVIARQRIADASVYEDKIASEFAQARRTGEVAENEITHTLERVEEWDAAQAGRIETRKDMVKAKIAEAKAQSAKIKAVDTDKLKAKFEAIGEEIDELNAAPSDALDAKLETLGAAGKIADGLKAKLYQAQGKETTGLNEFKRILADIKSATLALEAASGRVGEPCDDCGRPLEEKDLATVIEKAKDKVTALKIKGRAEKAAGILLSDAVNAAQVDFMTALAKVPDMSAILAEKNALKEHLRDAHNRLQIAQDALNGISDMVAHLEALKLSAVDLKTRMDEAIAETNPHTPEIDRRHKAKAVADVATAQAEDALNKASYATLVAKRTAEVFGPKGVRAHILDTVTPFLNDRTAYYIGALSDGAIEAIWSTLTLSKAGELKEKFTITVEKNGAGTFKGLSGGEKRKVRLATMLALQDLVASRATKPISLWIGDEIDTALDSSGLERLMGLLEMKARERGTVLIVSHHDLKHWVRDTVTVTMENQVAKVEGVLCV